MPKLKNNGDFLAQSMNSVLNNSQYKEIFNPYIEKKAEIDPLQQAYQMILSVSEQLEEMGFEKSASLTLDLAEQMLSELKGENND